MQVDAVRMCGRDRRLVSIGEAKLATGQRRPLRKQAAGTRRRTAVCPQPASDSTRLPQGSQCVPHPTILGYDTPGRVPMHTRINVAANAVCGQL